MYVKLKNASMEELHGRKVILFGAGSYGQRCIEEFEKIGAVIVGFADNDRTRRGELIEGYPVFTPEELLQHTDARVMITSTYVEEIGKQLEQMGISDYDAVCLGALHDTKEAEDFFKPLLSAQEANEKLYQGILSNQPFFAGRLGSNELECIVEYRYMLDRIHGKKEFYHSNLKLVMKQGAGFFPVEDECLDQFAALYLEKLTCLDLVWSMWLSRFEDQIYQEYIPQQDIGLYDETAFPIKLHRPWTQALEGKKVLVIHPFEDSIRENYDKKELFFEKTDFLPDFELITLKAVQSIGEEQPEYKDWFEALEFMKKQISALDFDVALIGAGAYGFPLGAYIKELGKKAIHIGGMLQLFFGIRGKAWNKLKIYNEYWTSPKESEKPLGYQKVEAGRYW